MNTIDKIRAEIERLKEEQLTRNSIGVITGSGVFVNATSLLSFLDTLEEPVSDDLEEAAENIYKVPFGTRAEDFKAGAEWQKEQMSEWRVLPGCEELTPEEKMNHPLYLEGFDMGREVQKVFDVEWSEADEVYLEDALWCVEKAEKSCKNENDKGACWSAKRWLKSLRNSYKPEWNEEDEKMIETICKEGDLKPSEQRWLKSLPERFNLQSKQ